MARQIDQSKPLSDDDREWLRNTNQHGLIARLDAEHGVEAEESGPSQSQAQREVSRLADYLYREHDVADSENPVDAVIRLLTQEPEDESVPFADETPAMAEGRKAEGGQEADDYASWTNDDLREELGRRSLSKSGTKDDLVARLEEDDEDEG